MTRLSDDCFAAPDRVATLAEALATLLPKVAPIAGRENVKLSAALERILADDIVAPIDVPAADNAAVDGYAVRFDDLDPARETVLPVAGRAAAGHPLGDVARGVAVRIFTGAIMPLAADDTGPDTVVMQEDCREQDGRVTIPPGVTRGANRRRAGEDLKRGAVALRAGLRLRPQDLGLAASLGLTVLPVHSRLRAALFSTGDELAEPGAERAEGQIYDSNRVTLRALLAQIGVAVDDLGILRDRRETVEAALRQAAISHDLIVTSGGVSVGAEDHVKQSVAALGRIDLWRLAIKPGRPIALGQIRTGARSVPFFGLPGNPVAANITFLRVVRPLLLKLMGAADLEPHLFRVPADFAYSKKKARREWVRARLATDGDGRIVARASAQQGSGVLSSMVAADGLVELPEDMTELVPGTIVDFLPFSEVAR